jgi:hypothetical protein
MATNMARNNPMVMASLEKNIFEHISLMAQEQIELEFRNELQQLQQLQMQAQANPMMAQQIQMQVMQTTQQIEARKAQLIAEMMEEFMNEEKKITSQFENARKEREGKERMDLDRMRAMMNQENQDEKLEQNEELANLRADTSIQKTVLSKTLPNADSMMPKVDIIRKGN